MVFSAALVRAAVELLESGMPEAKIAGALGVASSTWHLWKQRGRKETEGKYYNFVKRMEKARHGYLAALVRKAKQLALDTNIQTETREEVSADGKKKVITTITHKPQDARMLMFLLERGFPEEFRQQIKTDSVLETDIPTVLDFGTAVDNTDKLKAIEDANNSTGDTGAKAPDESGAT